MKHIFKLAIIIGLSVNLSACMSSPIPAILFTDGSVHHEDRTQSTQIGSGQILKKGESCSLNILYVNVLFFGAGNSISEAVKKADIKKIAVIDHRTFSLLAFLFVKDCVVVWGE